MADVHDLAISSLQAPALSNESAKSPEQLRALAAQFESLLLGQMLKDMRQSMFSDEEGEGSGFGTGPLADTLFSELSVALSRSGGMGLTSSLMGPLMAQAGIKADALITETAMPTEIPLPGGLDLPTTSPVAVFSSTAVTKLSFRAVVPTSSPPFTPRSFVCSRKETQTPRLRPFETSTRHVKRRPQRRLRTLKPPRKR